MDLPRLQEPVRVDSQAMISSVLKDSVLELWPARLEQTTALDEQMVDGLRASPKAAAADDAVQAVVLADLASGLSAETIAQSLLVDSDDHAEGVRAARDDRPLSFTGR
jgi:enoyl-CoA hydratase/carnithine racemase